MAFLYFYSGSLITFLSLFKDRADSEDNKSASFFLLSLSNKQLGFFLMYKNTNITNNMTDAKVLNNIVKKSVNGIMQHLL
jgi:hypothetical protein